MNAEGDKVIRKLRLDKACNILIVNAPKEFTAMLVNIIYDDKIMKGRAGGYDFVMVFATEQKELERLVKDVQLSGMHDCLFWTAYPKSMGPIKSNIRRETVWTALESIGMQTVTQIAIDETWTALRGRPAGMVGK